jgi:CRISPR/Cas system CSM-associated protein Csm3 (group 7 of RAMP superfamily)
MPIGEGFWNPYRIIQGRPVTNRAAPITEEKFNGLCGIISVKIKNWTPLFIGGKSTTHSPLLSEGKRIIPGSSLKGVLRSIAEIVGGGCFAAGKCKDLPNQDCCSSVTNLCICCRMFGAMERGSNARVHRGKVCIGEAQIEDSDVSEEQFLVLLANNGIRHTPFYKRTNESSINPLSRKLYFHQPQRTNSVPAVPVELRERSWTIKAIQPGHSFNFDIQFSNLTEEELRLLLYTINLEDNVNVEINGTQKTGPMLHKIGNAKPLGMGSCKLTITKLTLLHNPERRFISLVQKPESVYESEGLANFIREKITGFFQENNRSDVMENLRKMMVWIEDDERNFKYPGYMWFQNQENKSKPLKEI